MSNALQSLAISNPNPRFSNRASMSAFIHSPLSFQFNPLVRPHNTYKISTKICSNRVGFGLPGPKLRPVLALAASHEDSNPSEFEVKKDGADESEEAWKQTLASFKEQALKMQSVSQEAYESYSKKATVILKETSEKLKIQAEKTAQDLNVIAKEISEESKEFLSTAAEKSPEELKDIVETFASSTDDLKEISQVRDFYVGIPYGTLLAFGGIASFMLTGSISAIRFGVILGGTLLALSISSLKSWKRGESSSVALKWQAVIATILFSRDVRMLFVRSSFSRYFKTLISGAVVAFYIYRITMYRQPTKGSDLEPGTES